MKRFRSYRVDNHTHTHANTHKHTLLKTIPPSLRSALVFDGNARIVSNYRTSETSDEHAEVYRMLTFPTHYDTIDLANSNYI